MQQARERYQSFQMKHFAGRGGHRQLSVLFERIARFCPECHIVITIRNQVDLIKSFWFGHASHLKDVPIPHKGKYVFFDNWLNWQFNEYQSNQGQLLLYDFSRLEWIIKHHIPKGSISFVPYETLPEFNQKNYSAIMSRILGVSGKELSEAMQIRTNCSSNRINPYFKKIKNLTQIIPAFARKRKMLILVAQKIAAIFWKAKPEEYRDEHIRKIIDIYGQGNRMLSKRHSLELKERGYPWPGPIN